MTRPLVLRFYNNGPYAVEGDRFWFTRNLRMCECVVAGWVGVEDATRPDHWRSPDDVSQILPVEVDE